MIDQFCEMTGMDANETRQALALIGCFIASVVLALVLMAGWVAVVIYWIIPLHLDSGAGIGFLRIALAVGGDIVIAVAYLIGLYAVTQ